MVVRNYNASKSIADKVVALFIPKEHMNDNNVVSVGVIEAVRNQVKYLCFHLPYLNVKPDAIELSANHSIGNVEILAELQLDLQNLL